MIGAQMAETICRMGCGHKCVQGNMYLIGAHRWHLTNMIELSMCSVSAGFLS